MLTAEWLHLLLFWYFSTEYHNSRQNIIILIWIYLFDIRSCALAKSVLGIHKRKHFCSSVLTSPTVSLTHSLPPLPPPPFSCSYSHPLSVSASPFPSPSLLYPPPFSFCYIFFFSLPLSFRVVLFLGLLSTFVWPFIVLLNCASPSHVALDRRIHRGCNTPPVPERWNTLVRCC